METLLLCSTDGHTQNASVSPKDTISVLDKALDPSSQNVYIFAGLVLIKSFTFEFYGIKDRSIVMYASVGGEKPEQPKRNDPCPHYRLTGRAADTFKIAMGYHQDSDTELVFESSRSKDVIFMKVEGNLLFHKRLMAKFKQINEDEEPEETIPTVFETARLEGPSTEGLPSFWSEPARNI